MSSHLKVKVDDRFDFDICKDDISNLDITQVSNSKYHLLQNNKSFHTKVVASNFTTKEYEVSVNNTAYKVSVSNDLDILVKDMGFTLGSKKAISSIIAPMPRLILDVSVVVGQEVKENDPLLILEAIKMENSITSPIDGIIKAVHSNKGDAVEKNQLIIEFE